MKTLNILSSKVACTDYQSALEWVYEKIKDLNHAYAVEAANTHVITMAQHEADFGKVMGKFDLILPDGMPLIWSLNRQLPKNEQLQDRVYGPELMRLAISTNHSEAKHFLLGGQQKTLDIINDSYANQSQIVGSYSPPFGEWDENEFDKICDLIKTSGANLIWVSFGCPKQERWIADHKSKLPNGVYFGIGAAFDFIAGQKPQAPAFFQKNGLEWVYRLASEPKRLWKRYFIYNSLFILYTAKNFFLGNHK